MLYDWLSGYILSHCSCKFVLDVTLVVCWTESFGLMYQKPWIILQPCSVELLEHEHGRNDVQRCKRMWSLPRVQTWRSSTWEPGPLSCFSSTFIPHIWLKCFLFGELLVMWHFLTDSHLSVGVMVNVSMCVKIDNFHFNALIIKHCLMLLKISRLELQCLPLMGMNIRTVTCLESVFHTTLFCRVVFSQINSYFIYLFFLLQLQK